MTDIERSDAELRGTVLLAGKEIPVLAVFPRVLGGGRAVARKEGSRRV
jgi:hypothetical protein